MSIKGIRPEMANHPLSKAAREINAYAEEHGLADTCEHYDLAVDDVRYIAEQRALRAIYAFKGINLTLKESTLLTLSHEESMLMIQLTTAYMDGLVTGWRAKEIAKEEQ